MTNNCRGECDRQFDVRRKANYEPGYVFCSRCHRSFMYEGLFCPCCGCRVRKKLRPAKKTKHTKDFLRGKKAEKRTRKTKECGWCHALFVPPKYKHAMNTCSPHCHHMVLNMHARYRYHVKADGRTSVFGEVSHN